MIGKDGNSPAAVFMSIIPQYSWWSSIQPTLSRRKKDIDVTSECRHAEIGGTVMRSVAHLAATHYVPSELDQLENRGL